jgi:glycosyltransferase involved in cell wall biosynthesis
MISQQPLIDVLIPVFNGERTVQESVASILDQTFQDIIVHVVNDGSTDGTDDILNSMATRDRRLRVYSKPNGGIVDALNFGLAHCTAPLIARHDADDIAYPNRFQVQRDYLISHPDCVAVGASVHHIDVDGNLTGSSAELPSPEGANPFWVPSKEPYLMHPFLMMRQKALLAAGGYRYVHHSEDTDLYWRLSQYGRLHNLPNFLGKYRLHGESISGRSIKNGRIMSVSSQLAAVSEKRRRMGKPDLTFDSANVEQLERCASLAELISVGSRHLSEDERAYLEIAACAKLLELAAYRPYELEAEDCLFFRSVFRRRIAHLSKDNKKSISLQISGTAARLVSQGRFRDGYALLSSEFYAPFLYRLMLRVMMPESMRLWLRSRLIDGIPVK